MDVLRITEVKSGGQGYQLGVGHGDLLLTYNGKTVTSNEDLGRYINECTDETVIIEIYRNGSILQKDAKSGSLGISVVAEKSTDRRIEEQLESIRADLQASSECVNIILTTSYFLSNKEIEKEIEVITAECVYGMNFFKEFVAGFTDTFGGRSKITQKVFRDARKTALHELKKEAYLIGADAVIGVDINYSEVSVLGKAGGMIMVVASGTAVSVKKEGL